MYDTKPVHFLSMVCESIKWNVKEKIVYNVDTGVKEPMKFLRLSYIETYNNEMGNVDIANQYQILIDLIIGCGRGNGGGPFYFEVLV